MIVVEGVRSPTFLITSESGCGTWAARGERNTYRSGCIGWGRLRTQRTPGCERSPGTEVLDPGLEAHRGRSLLESAPCLIRPLPWRVCLSGRATATAGRLYIRWQMDTVKRLGAAQQRATASRWRC